METGKTGEPMSTREQICELEERMCAYYKEVMKHLERHDERLKKFHKEFEAHRKATEKHHKKMRKHFESSDVSYG